MSEKGKKRKNVFPPGIEPGTLSVLDSRDNHYTTETTDTQVIQSAVDHTNDNECFVSVHIMRLLHKLTWALNNI